MLPLWLPAVLARHGLQPSAADPPQHETADRTAGQERRSSRQPGIRVDGRAGRVRTGRCRRRGTWRSAGSSSGSAPRASGQIVTFWVDCDMIHLSIGGARVKTVRSHLSVNDLAMLAANGGRPAGPPPLPPAEPGAASRSTVRSRRHRHPGRPSVLAAEILGGRQVGIRIEQTDPDVLRPGHPRAAAHPTQPAHPGRPCDLRGVRPAGPPPGHRPSRSRCNAAPRTPASSWSLAEDRPRPRPRPARPSPSTSPPTPWPSTGQDDTRIVRRTTTQPVRNIKAPAAPKAAQFPSPPVKDQGQKPVKHQVGQDTRNSNGVTRHGFRQQSEFTASNGLIGGR